MYLVISHHSLTWGRPPWWICRPPPSHCPSGTCQGMAGNAPGKRQQRQTLWNDPRHLEGKTVITQEGVWGRGLGFSPLRRGQRSCGSRWGSSWLLTAAAEQKQTTWGGTKLQFLTKCVSWWAAHLRISFLKRSVWGHVFDDVSQNGVGFTFLEAKENLK